MAANDTAVTTAVPDENRGPMLLATIYPLFGITLFVYAFRIWCRLTPKFALTIPDYIITIAMIAKVISIGFMTTAIQHGFGHHTAHIPTESIGLIGSYLLGVYMTGVVVSSFARVSIAALILRFTTNKRWRAAIWAIIALQIAFLIAYETVQIVQCRTVITDKTRVKGSKCMMKSQVRTFTYASTIVCMISDLVCSAVPMFIVWKLSRSVVEKSLVIVLMASCLSATACGIPKVYYMTTYDFATNDGLWDLIDELFWCRLEEAIIIIAACTPLLKGPIERLLHRLGLPTFSVPVRELNRISSIVLDSKSEGAWPEEGHRQWTASTPSDEEGNETTASVVTTKTNPSSTATTDLGKRTTVESRMREDL